VDGTGSGSYPMAGFCISGAEPSGSGTSRYLVCQSVARTIEGLMKTMENNFTFRPLYPRSESGQYTSDRKLYESQSRSSVLSLPVIETQSSGV